jgi:hypothetical protein
MLIRGGKWHTPIIRESADEYNELMDKGYPMLMHAATASREDVPLTFDQVWARNRDEESEIHRQFRETAGADGISKEDYETAKQKMHSDLEALSRWMHDAVRKINHHGSAAGPRTVPPPMQGHPRRKIASLPPPVVDTKDAIDKIFSDTDRALWTENGRHLRHFVSLSQVGTPEECSSALEFHRREMVRIQDDRAAKLRALNSTMHASASGRIRRHIREFPPPRSVESDYEPDDDEEEEEEEELDDDAMGTQVHRLGPGPPTRNVSFGPTSLEVDADRERAAAALHQQYLSYDEIAAEQDDADVNDAVAREIEVQLYTRILQLGGRGVLFPHLSMDAYFNAVGVPELNGLRPQNALYWDRISDWQRHRRDVWRNMFGQIDRILAEPDNRRRRQREDDTDVPMRTRPRYEGDRAARGDTVDLLDDDGGTSGGIIGGLKGLIDLM